MISNIGAELLCWQSQNKMSPFSSSAGLWRKEQIATAHLLDPCGLLITKLASKSLGEF